MSREFQVMGDKILKSGRRIRAESNADGIFYFAGAPETEASVVPVLEIVNLDESKPYYREGDELHLQWRLRNDGTKTGYMGGVFYVKSVSMGEDFKPIYDTDTIQEGDGTPINPGEAGTTAGNFTLTVPKNTGASVNMDGSAIHMIVCSVLMARLSSGVARENVVAVPAIRAMTASTSTSLPARYFFLSFGTRR